MVASMHQDPKIERTKIADGSGSQDQDDAGGNFGGDDTYCRPWRTQGQQDMASLSRLKPPLASIRNAIKYMGDPSRAMFYAVILPQLETLHLGRRHFVVVASMDRLIESLKKTPERPLAQSHEPVGIAGPREPRNPHRQSPKSASLETCNNSDPTLPLEAGTTHLSQRRKRRREGVA
jgi:hypothetical protein